MQYILFPAGREAQDQHTPVFPRGKASEKRIQMQSSAPGVKPQINGKEFS